MQHFGTPASAGHSTGDDDTFGRRVHSELAPRLYSVDETRVGRLESQDAGTGTRSTIDRLRIDLARRRSPKAAAGGEPQWLSQEEESGAPGF